MLNICPRKNQKSENKVLNLYQIPNIILYFKLAVKLISLFMQVTQ